MKKTQKMAASKWVAAWRASRTEAFLEVARYLTKRYRVRPTERGYEQPPVWLTADAHEIIKWLRGRSRRGAGTWARVMGNWRSVRRVKVRKVE